MSNKKFQLVKKQVDAARIWSTPPVGALTAIEDAPICIKAESQVGIVICEKADQDLIDAAPDGVLFELDVTSYLLKDVTAGAVAGNILFEQSSKAVVHKVDGDFYDNNAVVGAFNPNAILINAIVDNVGLSEVAITSF